MRYNVLSVEHLMRDAISNAGIGNDAVATGDNL
jgi:hypothetical protein